MGERQCQGVGERQCQGVGERQWSCGLRELEHAGRQEKRGGRRAKTGPDGLHWRQKHGGGRGAYTQHVVRIQRCCDMENCVARFIALSDAES